MLQCIVFSTTPPPLRGDGGFCPWAYLPICFDGVLEVERRGKFHGIVYIFRSNNLNDSLHSCLLCVPRPHGQRATSNCRKRNTSYIPPVCARHIQHSWTVVLMLLQLRAKRPAPRVNFQNRQPVPIAASMSQKEAHRARRSHCRLETVNEDGNGFTHSS